MMLVVQYDGLPAKSACVCSTKAKAVMQIYGCGVDMLRQQR